MFCKFLFIYQNKIKIKSYVYKFFIKISNLFLKLIRRILKSPNKFIKRLFKFLPYNFQIRLRKNSFFSGFREQNTARWFISKEYNVETFFIELKKQNISYVVLRWWENLPSVLLDEDIDILIEDKDFKILKPFITKSITKYKLDIYTVNGNYGGLYRDIPYYPQNLSNDILLNKVLYKNIYYVANDEYYLYSLAYHVLFHKGKKSGIEGFKKEKDFVPEHNYINFLSKLANEKLCLDIIINTNNLYNVLKKKDYLPSLDLLSKLGDIEKSVNVFLPVMKSDIRGGELSLFIIREKVITEGKIDIIKKIIEHNYKMDIIDSVTLEHSEKDYLTYNMRGGNWNQGPYPKSGGKPSLLLIVFDYYPTPLSSKIQKNYPSFTNGNVFKCKNKIRDIINSELFLFKQYNSIHSCDNENESLFFLKKILSSKNYNSLETVINEKREDFKTNFPILKTISKGRRSKVEIINYKGQKALKKTFMNKYKRFFEREVFAYDILSKELKNIPKLLEKGDNFLIIKFYDEISNIDEKYKIFKEKKAEIMYIYQKLFDLGYAHLNITPDNILITKENELLLIDFEFLFKYEKKPNCIQKGYDIIGMKEDVNIDLPSGYSYILNSYNCQWKKIIGDFYDKN